MTSLGLRYGQEGMAAARRLQRAFPSLGLPHDSVSEFLLGYCRHLAELSEARSGEIRINHLGRVILSRCGRAVTLDWLSEQGPGKPGSLPHAGSYPQAWTNASTAKFSQDIVFGEDPLGRITLALESAPDPKRAQFLTESSRLLAFMVKRYEVRNWAKERLGHALFLVGTSDGLREVEAFTERAASSDLPVLLRGEFGTEATCLAAAIHCLGPRRDMPFIQVNCTQPSGTPEEWFVQAEGGTLFLSHVDCLPTDLQNQLPQHMHSRLGQWLGQGGGTRARMIASASDDLRRLVEDRLFSRPLLAELDFLGTTIPPLRARGSDLELHVRAILHRHGFRPDAKITPDMVEILERHHWPENLYELERVVARLAVMTGTGPIRAEDVRHHLPELTGASGAAPEAQNPLPHEESQLSEPASSLADDADPWVSRALNRDMKALSVLHPGLRKALLHMAEHHADPIRLGPLARHSHVSQSHLSFLFRTTFQTSAKGMLARIRVEKAKSLLAGDPRQPITEVALQVGFSDLSHFEKCFRRRMGLTPRDFRRLALGQPGTAKA